MTMGSSPCGENLSWLAALSQNISAYYTGLLPDNCSDNATSPLTPDTLPDGELAWWALVLCLFPCCAVFGNILVVISVVREKSLQNVTNYFITSLALADLMVALLVMPLAVYVTVKNGLWDLGDTLCDTWVALDVMFSTASIVHLAAISYDRYIAVIQPIRYAKQSKETKRVHITLTFCWLISGSIALPIVFGTNYYDGYRDKRNCIFYNADFFIPCVVTVLLYGRILRAIRQRAKRAKLQGQKKGRRETLEMSHQSPPRERVAAAAAGSPRSVAFAEEETLRCREREDVSTPTTQTMPTPTLISKANELSPLHQSTSLDGIVELPPRIIMNQQTSSPRKKRNGFNLMRFGQRIKVEVTASRQRRQSDDPSKNGKTGPRKRQAQRQERKATKTLAIVLAVFLFCWIPFFTANNKKAICMIFHKEGGEEAHDFCDIDAVVMGTFVWLGYINSFMNPVIYTIFNPDFKRAFQKVLCTRRGGR